jgi:hypothetical protein
MANELVAAPRLFPHSPMTGDETKLLIKWESWATDEFGDPHRAKTAAAATVVSSCVGLPDASFIQAARTGANIGSARSAALCSNNLDEMFENLVAFGWRPVTLASDERGQSESVARVRATASVHKQHVTAYRRPRAVAAGPMGRPLAVMWWLVDLPGMLLRDHRMRRVGYGWLDDEDGWLVITATEARFVGDRRDFRVPVGEVSEIRETSDLAMLGATPEARLRVAQPSLILALLHWLQSPSHEITVQREVVTTARSSRSS